MTCIERKQLLPIPIEEAWRFFTNPSNLNAITPEKMAFTILNEIPDKIYEGLIIRYKIKPLLNIPVNWVTEITHIKPMQFFVDEQRLGPYAIWHHEHHFKKQEDGVLMTDLLYYHIGKSVLGWMAGKLFVDRSVNQIFDYRHQVLQNYFNK